MTGLVTGAHAEARYARGQMQSLRAHLRAVLRAENPNAHWSKVLVEIDLVLTQGIGRITECEAAHEPAQALPVEPAGGT